MPKTCHIVLVVLNAYLGPVRGGKIHGSHGGDELPRNSYLNHRSGIFATLTAASLAAQGADDFHVVLIHDRRLAAEPFVRQRSDATKSLGDRLHIVGVPPIDFKRDLANAFWKPRPQEDAKIIELAGDAERLLITHIDSDDCYRSDAIFLYANKAHAPTTRVLMCTDGYLHDVQTGRVSPYHSPSTPFYTLIYKTADYAAGRRYHGGAGHHSFVTRKLQSEEMPTGMFMVNIHGANDSTRWRSDQEFDAVSAAKLRSYFGLP